MRGLVWPAAEGERSGWPTPRRFYHDPAGLDAVAERLRDDPRLRFFHWELAFPEVFLRENRDNPGLDAVVGNPPWDIQKPNSLEFFSNHNPIYRTFDKQEALAEQERLFQRSPALRDAWEDYQAHFKAFSNFAGSAADPWDDSLGQGRQARAASEQWARLRAGRQPIVPPPHPFRHQGSADLNSYKLFLERAHGLLRPGAEQGDGPDRLAARAGLAPPASSCPEDWRPLPGASEQLAFRAVHERKISMQRFAALLRTDLATAQERYQEVVEELSSDRGPAGY